MSTVESINVLNIKVLNIDAETLLRRFTNGCLFTPNVDHFVLLQNDEEFYRAYRTAEYVVLDSQVIFLLWKLRRKSFKAKIAGSDFFPRFCEYHKDNKEIKIFILGGMKDVAVKVQKILNMNAQRNIVVGTYSPPFGFESNDFELNKIVSLINSSDANTLAVGFGAPKQEKWIFRNREKLKYIKIIMCIGGTLDFISGKQKRAPQWMQNTGLEWFYRLLHDPKRLYKRYLRRDVQFFYYFIMEMLKIYKNPFEKQFE